VLECDREDEGEPRSMFAFVAVPNGLDRFVRLPPRGRGSRKNEVRFAAIETVISLFAGTLLPGFKVKEAGLFRLLRNSENRVPGKERGSAKGAAPGAGAAAAWRVIRLRSARRCPKAQRSS